MLSILTSAREQYFLSILVSLRTRRCSSGEAGMADGDTDTYIGRNTQPIVGSCGRPLLAQSLVAPYSFLLAQTTIRWTSTGPSSEIDIRRNEASPAAQLPRRLQKGYVRIYLQHGKAVSGLKRNESSCCLFLTGYSANSNRIATCRRESLVCSNGTVYIASLRLTVRCRTSH